MERVRGGGEGGVDGRVPGDVQWLAGGQDSLAQGRVCVSLLEATATR